MATTTATAETVARCGRGHFVRGSWDDAGRNGGWLICSCGARGMAKAFAAKFSDTKCSLRCTSSLGPSCSCECGGRGHGSDHRA